MSSTIDYIVAAKLMLTDMQAATPSVSGWNVFETVVPISENPDNVPAFVLRVLGTIEGGIYTVKGSFTLDLVQLTTEGEKPHDEISRHSDITYEVLKGFRALSLTKTGYLVNATYDISEEPSLVGETGEVVDDSNVLWSQIQINFGLEES